MAETAQTVNPGMTPAKRKMFFFAHHDRTLSDSTVRQVLRECSPKTNHLGEPFTQQHQDRWLANAKKNQFRNSLGSWEFPVLYTVHSGAAEGRTSVSVVLRQGQFATSLSRLVEIPVMKQEELEWIRVNTLGPTPHLATQYGAEWFMDKFRPTIPIFGPDFAFADNDLAIMQNLDKNPIHPKDLAWPLMIYGPTEVKRIGKQKLLDAPAWKVEELDYGGIWIQVAENPFIAAKDEVAKLAKHLGIPARKGKQNSEDWLK